jgi:hypothetical protein
MRQAIANLIEVARLSFNGKAPSSLTEAQKLVARCTTSHIASEPAQHRLKDLTPMNTAFIRSPLVDAEHLSLGAVDAILTVYADGNVQRQAAEVRAKLIHVIELAGMRSEIAAAVQTIGTHSNAGLTPAAVVAVLRQRAAEMDDMLEDARADRDAHEAARRARMACTEPLHREVSKRLTSLVAERDSLLGRVDAHRRAASMGFPSNGRFNALIAAGISAESIASLGVEDPDVQANKLRARIAAVDEELKPLTRFTTGGDVADLAGLGLDALLSQAYPDRVGAGVAA